MDNEISTEKLALRLEFLAEMWEESAHARFVSGLRASADRLRKLEAQLDESR